MTRMQSKRASRGPLRVFSNYESQNEVLHCGCFLFTWSSCVTEDVSVMLVSGEVLKGRVLMAQRETLRLVCGGVHTVCLFGVLFIKMRSCSGSFDSCEQMEYAKLLSSEC